MSGVDLLYMDCYCDALSIGSIIRVLIHIQVLVGDGVDEATVPIFLQTGMSPDLEIVQIIRGVDNAEANARVGLKVSDLLAPL
jgi:hypothetical protein